MVNLESGWVLEQEVKSLLEAIEHVRLISQGSMLGTSCQWKIVMTDASLTS